MTNNEIENILQSNDNDKLSFYLSNLLSKAKDIEKENNKLGIMMLVLVLLFYLIETAKANALNIGPISINNLTTIKVFIPLVFSFLILRYKIINSHKAEIIKIVKKFSNNYFGYENTNVKPEFTDDFTRTLLPISIYEEFNKFNYKGASKFGCLGALLILPLTIGLTIAPYYIEYIWLKELFSKYPQFDFWEKSATIFTVWILLLSLYYFIHTMIFTIKETK